jgi:NAD(P)H-hydrate epimerase
MKILRAEQIRAWDQATIQKQQISSLELMERAALACTEWICARYRQDTPVVVACGTGNNGGDGLAITRLLIQRGYSVMAFLLMHRDSLTQDCSAQLSALKDIDPDALRVLTEDEFITDLPAKVLIIDALFGTGINRQLEGFAASFVNRLNKLPNVKVAIDLPSGLPVDSLPDSEAPVVSAMHTLCFQQYKRSMLHPESGALCGQVHLLDIGLDHSFPASQETYWYTSDLRMLRNLYKPRQAFSNKGTYGHALIVGGSKSMVGAVLLALRAAGRAGAGKVRALIPECGYEIIQSGAPEALCQTNGEDCLGHIAEWETATAIGVGPGIGTDAATAAALEHFLNSVDKPLVLDADALNLLAMHPELMGLVPPNSIITPHPKELERLFGKSSDSFERAELARQRAMQHQWLIVAKDHHTLIALPDGRAYYNTSGNAGLATAGSGDVLTGILTGLLAQGYTPESAALLGVWLHGYSADLAIHESSMEALVAGDLERYIGAAFRALSS